MEISIEEQKIDACICIVVSQAKHMRRPVLCWSLIWTDKRHACRLWLAVRLSKRSSANKPHRCRLSFFVAC